MTLRPGPHPHVLVVEDESRLRELLVRAIPDMGFPATGARSAEDALRTLEVNEHRIIVLDLNLPGMSGLEFLAEVRQRWPGTAVIVLTGYGSLESARQAIHLDVVEFLTKPCPLGDLEVALDRAYRRVQSNGTKDPLPPIFEDAEPAGAATTLDSIERQHIMAALERHQGNRSATAAELGISLRTLYYRLAEYQKQGYRVE